jgi:hypothetical protein
MCGCLEQKPHNHSHPAILVSLLNQWQLPFLPANADFVSL